MENWKEVAGYDGKYLISDAGRVFSKHNNNFLATPINNYGYPTVTLWKNGKRKKHIVSRLVASAFIDNPDGKTQVNHKNGNKLNNYAYNLEWTTPSENVEHAIRTGLSKTSKKVVLICLNTNKKLEFDSMSKASRFLGKNTDFVGSKLRKESQAFYNNYRLEKVK